jgi:lactoylglutathione lyase
MAKVEALNHVALNVRNLQGSLKFYQEGLGLTKTLEKLSGKDSWRLLRLPPGTRARTVFLRGEGYSGQIELAEWDLAEPENSTPKRAGDPGYWVLSFRVGRDEIRPLYDQLIAMGVECYSEPVSNMIENYGVVTMFICEDPDGNQIEIVSLPTREERKASREASGSGR